MSQPPQIITDLVQKFERNIDEYRNPKYNETLIRVEFVNPFWKALGWDVDNEKGYSLNYRDVIHEDELKVGSTSRAPDYAFRAGNTRVFFLETKKPAVDLKTDPAPAFQLRRYAYSAKLPVSLLTDFEELIVYNCRLKPAMTDKPHIGRMMYYTFREYIEKWDEISGIFSREAVMQGALERFIETTQGKRPRTEIDRDFLNDLDNWRIELARNIALRNQGLTERELNYAVQLTIDRLIFLRMCEDRDIEQYETLMALLNGTQIYRRLVELYYKADERYNSGLFHFEEKDGANPDRITPKLEVDDKILKEIISELYYPKCPYEFSVLPVEVLGNAYEQFLGKKITLTEGHRARIEEKPEVRKAGGVYYTPQYIVDYIVRNTVGKLCEGKTPRDVSELRILDPACGSGSFLLGAYQYLLDWHVNWYRAEYERTGQVPQIAPVVVVDKIHSGDVVEKIHEFSLRRQQRRQRQRELSVRGKTKQRKTMSQAIFQGKGGEWFLTTAEKKRILLNNIYGVDIDANAVEVTKLSLLLKVLEHETSETLNRQLGLWHERALPNLDSNIKCGNSLIGTDFYEGQSEMPFAAQAGLFNEEEALRINAFDWEREFAEIFAKGGFDAVIGNPPYVDIKGMPERDVDFIFSKYATANNRINLFAVFIEKSLQIIKCPSGYFSMIIPTALLMQESYKTLRKNILLNNQIVNIARLPNESFGASAGDVKVDTTIIVLSGENKSNYKTEIIAYEGYDRVNQIDPETSAIHNFIYQSSWLSSIDNVWTINLSESDSQIIEKCGQDSIELIEVAEFSLGLTPYDKYKGHTQHQIENKIFHADYKKNDTFKPLLAGNDVKRYSLQWNGKSWISYGPWLGAPREQRFFNSPRILSKQIIDWTAKRIWATYTEDEYYNAQNAFNIIAKPTINLFYLLGIMNSKLMSFYHSKKYLDEFKMRFQKILIKDCKRFPIKIIPSQNISQQDQLVSLVKQILEQNKKYNEAKDPRTCELMQRQIDATDRQIDQLVYQLYGLTEEEIRIVESGCE
jgi:type I restriction-modification system DNA methylase subunit/predicted type IV restriction endonuclease